MLIFVEQHAALEPVTQVEWTVDATVDNSSTISGQFTLVGLSPDEAESPVAKNAIEIVFEFEIAKIFNVAIDDVDVFIVLPVSESRTRRRLRQQSSRRALAANETVIGFSISLRYATTSAAPTTTANVTTTTTSTTTQTTTTTEISEQYHHCQWGRDL